MTFFRMPLGCLDSEFHSEIFVFYNIYIIKSWIPCLTAVAVRQNANKSCGMQFWKGKEPSGLSTWFLIVIEIKYLILEFKLKAYGVVIWRFLKDRYIYIYIYIYMFPRATFQPTKFRNRTPRAYIYIYI